MALEDLAVEHYRRQQGIARQTAGILTTLWDVMGPMGFRDQAGQAAQVVAAGQYAAAAQAQAYAEAAAVEQGVALESASQARAFSGLSAAGNALDVVLSVPTGRMFRQMDAGRDSSEAYQAARARVALIGRNEATQAGTDALGVSLAGNENFPQYVRMLTRPSCRRCVVLAGRKYYSAERFRRHEGCDCVHVPIAEADLADALVKSPEAYFESLTEAEQNKTFGIKHARAIRDGADIVKVVNRAERGAGILSRQVVNGRRVSTRRMTVSEIYAAADGDRDRLVALFTEQGYLGTSGLKPLSSSRVSTLPAAPAIEVVDDVAEVLDDTASLRRLCDDIHGEVNAPGAWERVEFDARPWGLRAVSSEMPGASAERALDRILEAGAKVDDEVQKRLALKLKALEGEVVAPPAEVVESVAKAEKALEKAQAAATAAHDAAFAQASDDFFLYKFAFTGGDSLKGLNLKNFDTLMGRAMTDAERADWAKHVSTMTKWDGKWRKAKGNVERATRGVERGRARLATYGSAIEEGSPRWCDALRESVTEVVGELHSEGVGGARQVWRSASGPMTDRSELKRTMDKAADHYPAAWNDLARKARPDTLLKSTKRGYNSGEGREIALSKRVDVTNLPQDADGLLRVAIHELGHTMEGHIPHLQEAEWAFLARRAGWTSTGRQLGDRLTTIYRNERGFRDDFGTHYTGKVYGWNPGDSYEVFTTGVEALLGGPYGRYMKTKSGSDDVEFRRFILGVLSVLGR